ncbi:MAG: metallophosphoesterase [Muricomes sp.]
MLARVQRLSTTNFHRVIAVSDIHGSAAVFRQLLYKIGFCQYDMLLLLGDYIERGEQSLELLRHIMGLCRQGNVFAIMGNCDNLVEEVFESRYRGDILGYMNRRPKTILHEMLLEQGQPFGENTTLEQIQNIVNTHYAQERTWLLNLPHILETETHIFVHAGLDEGSLDEQDDNRCLKRQDFIKTDLHFKKPVVVGHIPCLRLSDNLSTLPIFDFERNIIFIDGGIGTTMPAALNALIIDENGYRVFSVPEF